MTQHNPFDPPKSDPLRLAANVRRAARPPRPISAWLLEAMLAFMATMGLASLWRLAWTVALDERYLQAPLRLLLAAGWQVGVLVLMILAIRAIHRGRRWARWVGLALIAAMAVFSVVRTDDAAYPNDAQRAGADLAHYVFLPVLCGWWAWAFAFSAKARRFFAPAPIAADGEPVPS